MKDELVALQEKITVAEKTAKDADASVKTLEKEMREFATNRDGKIKKIEKEVAAAKADLSKRNIAFKGKQRELLTCRQDKEALEVELREASLLLESSGAALKALIIEEQTLAKEEASIKVGWMASCCGLLLLTHVRAHSTRTHTHTHTVAIRDNECRATKTVTTLRQIRQRPQATRRCAQGGHGELERGPD